MPEQHMRFYQDQTLLFLGAEDNSGALWASVVAGTEPSYIFCGIQGHVSKDSVNKAHIQYSMLLHSYYTFKVTCKH